MEGRLLGVDRALLAAAPRARPAPAPAAAPSRPAAARRAAGAAPTPAAAPPPRGVVRAQGGAAAASAPSPSSVPTGDGKLYDVVALSNLCVDVVVPVERLPPADPAARRRLLADLAARPPPREQWEVGGNSNFLIAAARLGLAAASVGHVGDDDAGRFLSEVMAAEGVRRVEPLLPADLEAAAAAGRLATLLCFVLVAPAAEHAFCSAYDFGPWPLLPLAGGALPPAAAAAVDAARALFVNGFAFDELPAGAILDAARRAAAGGAAVFFDPGPRAWTFAESPERAAALAAMLDASDVVLMTADEAAAVTGERSAEAAALAVLARPAARTRWCIVKLGAEGALLAERARRGPRGGSSSDSDSAGASGSGAGGGRHELHTVRALRVDVRDTVGCGDSFAAAVVLGFTRRAAAPPTLALANAVGAATATGAGAGRNVARAAAVAELLRREVPGCGDGRHAAALGMLQESLDASSGDASSG